MDLFKRVLTILIPAILIVGLVYGYLWLRAGSLKNLEPYEAVPGSAILFLETENYSQLAGNLHNHNEIWKEFRSYKIITQIDRQIAQIDSISRHSPQFRSILRSPMIISVNPVSDGYGILFILNPGKEKVTQEMLKILSNEAGINKRKFKGQTVYDLHFKPGNILNELSFFEFSGLFILASSTELIETEISALKNQKGKGENKKFERLRSTRGNDAIANIYLNYQELAPMLNEILLPEKKTRLREFAEFSVLDLHLNPDNITLNGFTGTSDSSMQFMSVLQGQEPVEFSIDKIIPSNIAFFRLTGFNDARKLFNRMKDLEGSHPPDIILPENLSLLFSREAGEVVLSEAKGFSKYFIASVSARSIAEMALSSWVQSTVEGKGEKYEQYREAVVADNQTNTYIYKSPLSGLPSLIFPALYPETDYEYFSFVDNFIVFGNSPSSLKSFIYQNKLGKTLDNDKYYIALKNNFDSKSNLFIYFNPSRYMLPILEVLKDGPKMSLNKALKSWKKFDAVSLQSTSEEDIHYFHIFLHYSGSIREYVNTVWERKLETNAVFKPAIVLNHNTMEKEIFLQDGYNNIYLLDNAGIVLWKQQIDGPIMDEVHQVDFFNNGKLQLLFNTASKIYLIDRNGNPVGRFPVNLREKATAGLSLFDYENDHSFRICLPSENNDIYMYDGEGKVLPGWKFKKSDFPVLHPVNHYRIGNRDFIVAYDKTQVYLLDRRGDKRVTPTKQIEHSANNPLFPFNLQSQHAYLAGSDTSGTIYYFYFDGSVKKVLEMSLSSHHFFILTDLDGNGQPEYLFVDGKRLMAYSEDGRLLFEEALPDKITIPPVIFEFSPTDKKIGIVANISDRIYLFNKDGSLYEGFPLLGSSAFSISSFPGLIGRFNLIVANNDNFLYNYSVK